MNRSAALAATPSITKKNTSKNNKNTSAVPPKQNEELPDVTAVAAASATTSAVAIAERDLESKTGNQITPQALPVAATSIVAGAPPLSSFPPERYSQELDQLYSTLLDKFTKQQERTSQKIRTLQSELDVARQQIRELAVENYAASVVWSELVEEKIRTLSREQKERQKLVESFQTGKRREIESAKRRQAQAQHEKDRQDFGTSSYYSMALVRLELRECEVRRTIESTAMSSLVDLSQSFERGYNQVWRKFAVKMEKEMRMMEQLLVATVGPK